MPQVIGRVVTGTYETVRGPDVLHRVAIARDWLLEGGLVELALPRNLTCAACEGGGCDRCGRSGAIALRARGEAAEPLQLTLPKRTTEELAEQPSFVLRVPGQGGRDAGGVEARGLLLLRITAGSTSDPGVRLVREDAPIKRAVEKVIKAISARPAARGAAPNRRPWVAVLIVLAWISAVISASVLYG